jgi:antibiotic biosynthesis monooxygenase (ABM) superfamily enzyme
MTARWKEATLTWIGVNATAFTLALTLTPLISDWPWAAGFLAFNTAMVAGLTWLVMPVLDRLARGWLDSPRGDTADDYRGPDPAQWHDHHE